MYVYVLHPICTTYDSSDRMVTQVNSKQVTRVHVPRRAVFFLQNHEFFSEIKLPF